MKFSIVNVLVSGLLLAAASVDACQCKVGSRQGQYCGHCEAVLVTPDFVYDHVLSIAKACNSQFPRWIEMNGMAWHLWERLRGTMFIVSKEDGSPK
ncbi:mold-specific M46 protein [Histoplasma capsulatum var. duboisii H88]|uniref:Mold-specific M46 protein n=1 Tax=Ajellomyces capsulatus (strain H88) TaxID=544711 RepID=F0UDA1_AJEC8|nr:mold-specific M46 protein [Histoplasma capsulatum var. duboisii H88]